MRTVPLVLLGRWYGSVLNFPLPILYICSVSGSMLFFIVAYHYPVHQFVYLFNLWMVVGDVFLTVNASSKNTKFIKGLFGL
jgi:hypothetical protein